ncbi:type 1 fimbrial protein [Moellerella wisconsensis]|uniref:Type 1 fimbrial protein n=2 Tax=Moellerella wisconsensis TaxID=158849 RepID=A0ACD3Y4Y0_9GAMM|nr:type 1 fimbrial protein [Moellerella wisconsensis]KLN95984.1 hypothetical protein VK86_12640 [Moellerella wisconsensis]UNH23085.1 type 1 fimbrial protein [Moellerella wisconsensis]UNH26203.1 type 1 fimbrial protein [Moellerella wisconsensis]UNH29622.1 type 1 fimbrial protein [Moellerella wisconsensis]UNH37761.1 type 1 fimbrial protein [Moellerella wisconsensis]
MRKVLSALVIISLALGCTLGQAKPLQGRLYFEGRVVNAGCSIEINQQQADYQCYRQGVTYQSTQQLSSYSRLNQSKNYFMPATVGKYQVQWLDNQGTKGIINVQYF